MASEARYRVTPFGKQEVTIVISQSGETADTLSCLKHIKSQGGIVYAIVNVAAALWPGSCGFITTRAGPEIGVASTKAFTTQLVALITICCAVINDKSKIDDIRTQLFSTPDIIEKALSQASDIEAIANKVFSQAKAQFIGRGSDYPLALEGALLKEISYIHAEGLPAGELKHGSIALIDRHLPTFALLSQSSLREKTISNIKEITARGGSVVINKNSDVEVSTLTDCE